MTHAGLEQVTGEAAPVLARVTRLGFGVKGLLTVLVGVLALGRGGALTPRRSDYGLEHTA